MKGLLIISLLLFTCTLITGYPCSNTVITDTSSSLLAKTYTCGNGAARTVSPSASFTMPSGQTALSVTVDVKVTDRCGFSPASLFVATITPSGSTEKKIFEFIYNPDDSTMLAQAQQSTGGDLASNPINSGSIINQWVTLIGSLDLLAGKISLAWWSPRAVGDAGSSISTAGWNFDNTFKIYPCAAMGGSNAIACNINVKVIYKAFSSASPLLFDAKPVLLGDYLFKQGSGYSVANSAQSTGSSNRLDSLSFGKSRVGSLDATTSPKWLTSLPGVELETVNQYLSLSGFSAKSLPHYSYSASFSISFWVNISTLPITEKFVFRYLSSDGSAKLAVKLTPTGKIYCVLDDDTNTQTVPETTTSITPATWTQLTISFTTVDTLTSTAISFVSLSIGNTIGQAAFVPIQLSFWATDELRIGGFQGQVGYVKILSPGAQYTNSPSCDSTCSLDLGNANPAVCLKTVSCPTSTYPSQFACIDCPTGCASCTDKTTCQSCLPGYSFANSRCTACPSKTYALTPTSPTCTGNCLPSCETCPDATTCTTCPVGFARQNALCVACPTGTYAYTSSSYSCTDCPAECKSCTSYSSCQSCSSDFFLKNSTCNACPDTKYALSSTATTCEGNCRTGCKSCSNTTTCNSCQAGFMLQNSLCVACTTGSYASTSTSKYCSVCPSGCTRCTDSNTCQACSSKYKLKGSRCVKSSSSSAPVVIGVIGGIAVISAAVYYIRKQKMKSRATIVQRVNPRPQLNNSEQYPMQTQGGFGNMQNSYQVTDRDAIYSQGVQQVDSGYPVVQQGLHGYPPAQQGGYGYPPAQQGGYPYPQGQQVGYPYPQGQQGGYPYPQGQ